MIRIADHLHGSDVKNQNHALHRAGNYHGSGGPTGPTMLSKDVEHRILAVREGDINKAIRSIPAFEPDQVSARRAWSHYMAVMCSRHFFPDANHRTASATFSLALHRATGDTCFLPKEHCPDMVHQSKALRDRDEAGRLQHRRFTIADVADPEHPYRHVFRRFEQHLLFHRDA